MKTAQHPRTREGTAVLCLIVLIMLELVVLTTVPASERSLVSSALAGAAGAALAVVAVTSHRHRGPRQTRRQTSPDVVDRSWFTTEALEGFPMEAVRPLLRASDAIELERVYTAWVFATQGEDAVWIERHLGLPPRVAHLLVDSARRRSRGHPVPLCQP